jgi:hypothetical protein
MWRRGAVLLASSAMLLGACSKVSPPADNGPACEAWFDARARFEARCGTPEVIAERKALVRSRFVQICEEALSAPGTSKTASSVTKCAESLETRSCDPREQPKGSADPCGDAPGLLREGAVCFGDDQCRSGHCKKGRVLEDGGPRVPTLCGVCTLPVREGFSCGSGERCQGDLECVAGQCALVERKDLGAPCADPFHPCKPGGVCRDFVCAKAAGAGEPCSVDSDCDPALSCLQGKCATRPGEGAACDAIGQCARGLGCDLETKKCVKPVRVRFPDACTAETRLCEIGACAIDPGSTKGRCPSILPDGSQCDPANKGAQCDDFAACIDGECQIFQPQLCR